MSMSIAEIHEAILALDLPDRVAVIQRGLEALDDADCNQQDDADVESAWREEFRRRINQIEHGEVQLVTREESDARVAALLAELQR